ncbi:hypothetical protein ABZT51_44850, partial [Streptomyces sp. NPDC005373]
DSAGGPGNVQRVVAAGSAAKGAGGPAGRRGAAQTDIPRYIQLYNGKQLLLDELVSKVYPGDDIKRLLDDMHHGRIARGVLTF